MPVVIKQHYIHPNQVDHADNFVLDHINIDSVEYTEHLPSTTCGKPILKTISRHLFLISLLSISSRAVSTRFVGTEGCLVAPPLPAATGDVVVITNVSELDHALNNLETGTTLLLSPGDYQLNQTLYIQTDDITIRGDSDRCDQISLIGPGMEQANFGNVPHGIWTNATDLKVQNLTIRDVYYHPIQFDPGAKTPALYNLRLLDAGEQFIKGSSGGFGQGVNGGRVEYTIMAYTTSPPAIDHGGGTGYTNGIDIHGGDGWVIRNNLFKNFHTPDGSDHLWNPAVLMWNGARNTLTENNAFIDVDRAIAYGLTNRSTGTDHFGGIIRNNMVYTTPGLYSPQRRSNSDGLIIVWDSPQTQVLHNSILSNQNQRLAIEMRFNTTDSQVMNNLSDAPISARNGATYDATGNINQASPALFIDPQNGNLHLSANATQAIDQVTPHSQATHDIDGNIRPFGNAADVGADEYVFLADLIFTNSFDN